MRNLYLSLRGLVLSAFIFALTNAFGQQSVSIGTTTIDNDAVLLLLGDGTQGLIIPKTTDITTMPKKAGMVVYNESDGKVYSCNGNTWTALSGGASSNPPVLEINGNNVSIFTGVNVSLATTPPTNKGQLLMWDGTKWTSTSATDPTTGSVLVWNGSRWDASGNVVTNVTGTAPVSVAVSTTTRDISLAAGGITNTLLADNSVTSAKITDGTITAADLNSMAATSGQVLTFNGTAWAPASGVLGLPSTLASGNIFVGNATNIATGVAMSGDATVTNTGILTIANSAINSAKILDGTIVAADLNAMSATNGQVLKFNGTSWVPSADNVGGGAVPTLSSGQILIGDGTNNSAAALSGDATLSAGVITIGTGAITSTKILDGTIVATDLNSMSATSGQVLRYNGTTWAPATISGSGDMLKSVYDVNADNIVDVAASVNLGSQAANTFLAAPNGSAGTPSFRSMVAADLPNLDVSKLSTGTLGVARGGTGLSTTPTNGQLLIGNGTGYTLASLTAGSGITVTPGAGSITIASTSSGTVTSVAAGTGLTGGPITTSGTLAVNVGTGANQIPQLDGTGKLNTSVMPSAVDVNASDDVTTSTSAGGDLTGTYPNPTIGTGKVTSTHILDGTIAAADLSSMSATNGQILKYNGSAWVPAADDVGGGATPTLANGQILIGNGTTNSAAALSGDATLSAGVITIGTGAITSSKILDGTIAAADLNAMGATNGQVLTYNGTNWAPATGGGGLSSTLNSANIFVGNGSNVATGVALSGDATITNAGALTIANNAITSAKILDGTIAAADLNAMSATTGQVLTYNGANWAPAASTGLSSTLTSANIFVGNGSNVATGVAMSGDATISNAGTVTLTNSSASRANLGLGSLATLSTVTTAEITNGTIAAVDMANSSVSGGTGGIISDASITAADLAVGSVDLSTTDVTGTLPVTLGGTGATTVTTARTNLGLGTLAVASTIVSADITDATITGADLGVGSVDLTTTDVTGTLPLTLGGTGGTTAAAARTNLGLGGLAVLSTVGTSEITDASITNIKISNVGLGKLLQGGATTGQILKWDGAAWSPAADDVGGGATPTLSNGQVLIGNGTTNSAAALSGDATLSAGVITIGIGAITSAKILDGTIAAADLNAMSATTGQVLTYNGANWAPATSPGLSSTLTSANIFVGNGSNVATGVALSGDAAITNAGVLTIANNAITSAKISDGSVASADITDATIAAIDLANGSVSGGTGGVISDASITAADLAVGSVDLATTDVTGTLPLTLGGTGATTAAAARTNLGALSSTLANTNIYVGNAGTATAVAMSGDGTLSNTGVLTIASNAIGSAEITDATIAAADLAAGSVGGGLGGVIADGTINAADLASMSATNGQVLQYNGSIWAPATIGGGVTTLDGLTDVTVGTTSGGQLLVNDGAGQFKNASMSGDATLDNAAVITIANNAVTNAKIASVGLGKLLQGGATTGQTLKWDGAAWSPAASDLSTTLNSGLIYVGNASNVATASAMSGDGALSNTGVLTISSNAIGSSEITDATITGADLAVGSVDLATTDVTGTLPLTLGGTGATTAAAARTNLGALSTALTSANIFVGSAGNVATGVALSGDATLTNAGVLTVSSGAITSAKILDGTIAAIDLNAMGATTGQALTYNGTNWAPAATVSTTLASGNIYVGNGGNVATAVAMSGDGTLNNAGVLTLSASSVSGGTAGDITDATITAADLAVGAVDLATTDVTGTLPLTLGGTGATTAAAARTNLGALSSTLANTNIYVGNAGTATAVAMSGDGTLSNTGVLTLATGAVTTAKILDGTIANADLASGAVTASNGLTASAANNITLGGTLSSATSIAMGANNLTFTGTGNFNFQAGNVGIGVAASTKNLEIFNTTQPILRLRSGLNNTSSLEFVESTSDFGTSALGFRAFYDGLTDNFKIQSSAGTTTIVDHFIIDRGANRIGIGRNPTTLPLEVEGNMYVNGNIGVLTTSPSHDLTIKQSSNTTSNPNGVAVISATTANYWRFWTSGTLLRFSYFDGTTLSHNLYYQDGDATWTVTSDKRLKNSFEPVGSVLNDVMKLKPTRYYYNSAKKSTGKLYGFIAQDVESVFPSLVSPPNEENEYYGMNYENLHAISIKAIQEQQALIASQQAEIEMLKSKLSELDLFKAELQKLKELVGAEAKKTTKQ